MNGLIKTAIFTASASVGISFAGHAQNIQSPAILFNKISTRYRSIQSYNDTASWKMRIGEREIVANITLAAAQPNKYLLEVKGYKSNMLVWSDGNILSGYLSDKNTLARTKSPARLHGADVLNGLDIQMLGVRLITLLLEGSIRDADPDVSAALAKAKITGPQSFGGRQAYIVSFPWQLDFEARVYVGAEDLLIRRVTVLKNGSLESVESHESIQIDQPIASDTFVRPTPEAAKLVAALTPLDKLTSDLAGDLAPDFAVESLDGKKIRLSDLKGKVVIVNFFSLDDDKLDENFAHLVQIAKEMKDKGLEVISINEANDPQDDVADFIKKKQANHIIALNKPTDVAKLYKITAGSQTNVVINREGNQIGRFTGYFLSTIKNNVRKGGID